MRTNEWSDHIREQIKNYFPPGFQIWFKWYSDNHEFDRIDIEMNDYIRELYVDGELICVLKLFPVYLKDGVRTQTYYLTESFQDTAFQ